MHQRLLAALCLASALFAGCIAAPTPPTGDPALPSPAAEPVPTMTAEEDVVDGPAGPCVGSVLGSSALPPEQKLFCVTRTLTVTGAIDLDRLPITLSTLNKPITVRTGPAGEWRFVATIEAAASSEAQARAALDERFVWSHESASSHHLTAEVTSDEAVRVEAGYEVVMPEGVVLDLALDSTNGPIDVTATVEDATLDTTNGAIEAALAPARDGTIVLDSTNGAVSLRVPEDAGHGYDLSYDTTNGVVTIGLRDGTRSGDEEEGTFRTHGFASRAVRTTVTLDTTNGSITVQPA